MLHIINLPKCQVKMIPQSSSGILNIIVKLLALVKNIFYQFIEIRCYSSTLFWRHSINSIRYF